MASNNPQDDQDNPNPTDDPQTQPANEPPIQTQPWTPADYTSALTHLENLQSQLATLRSALPSIVSPLIRPSESKAQMFAEVKKAAVTSTGDLRAFRQGFESERTREVLGRARGSRESDGELGRGEGIGRWGWGEEGEKA